MVITGTASTAIDGERLTRERVPQLAIVDPQLGNEVAFDLVDHLHDFGVRVIVVSGLPIFSPWLANAAAVLQKPFTGQELWELSYAPRAHAWQRLANEYLYRRLVISALCDVALLEIEQAARDGFQSLIAS